MTGVQILNQWEAVSKSVFSWDSFFGGVAVGFGLVVLITYLLMIHDFEWGLFFQIIAFVGIITALVMGVVCGCVIATPVEYETRYEVTIDSEVSMQEFMDKYEIIETRGSIYTVREK